MKIQSRNELFPGEWVEKPPLAILAGREDPQGWPVMFCPHCNAEQEPYHCDVGGAEPGCMFCLKCHGEYEVPTQAGAGTNGVNPSKEPNPMTTLKRTQAGRHHTPTNGESPPPMEVEPIERLRARHAAIGEYLRTAEAFAADHRTYTAKAAHAARLCAFQSSQGLAMLAAMGDPAELARIEARQWFDEDLAALCATLPLEWDELRKRGVDDATLAREIRTNVMTVSEGSQPAPPEIVVTNGHIVVHLLPWADQPALWDTPQTLEHIRRVMGLPFASTPFEPRPTKAAKAKAPVAKAKQPKPDKPASKMRESDYVGRFTRLAGGKTPLGDMFARQKWAEGVGVKEAAAAWAKERPAKASEPSAPSPAPKAGDHVRGATKMASEPKPAKAPDPITDPLPPEDLSDTDMGRFIARQPPEDVASSGSIREESRGLLRAVFHDGEGRDWAVMLYLPSTRTFELIEVVPIEFWPGESEEYADRKSSRGRGTLKNLTGVKVFGPDGEKYVVGHGRAVVKGVTS